jgi:TolB protein
MKSKNCRCILTCFVIYALLVINFASCQFKPSSKEVFVSQSYQISLSYPSSWKAVRYEAPQIEAYAYEGSSGFFSISAIKNETQLTLLEIAQNEVASSLNDFGSMPELKKFYLNAREAWYIFPSSDQNKEERGKACMITFFPIPVWIDSAFYEVLILSVDKDHLEEITQSLEFLYK